MTEKVDMWLPPGTQRVPPEVRMAQEAIEAYSSELELGFDNRAQQWVVLWKNRGPEGAPFPAFGLGRELPGYEEIQRRLYSGDVLRRGGEVLKDVLRRQDAAKAKARAEGHEASNEVAEHLEYAFRRMGKTPYAKVFLPGKDFNF